MAVRGDNSLFFATGIDNSGLLKGKVEAEGIIQSLGSNVSKINPFAALAVGAVAALGLIANEGYKMSKAFESAMAEVKTIANVSEADFKKLEQNVFGIYKRLGTELPDKLAQGLYEIIGAGFEAGDALNILEISSKAATAGVTETAVAADGLTTILNAFKLTTGDAQEVADIMFATVDRGKISFEELSSQIATVAPLAASSNISFQEVGAAISTLTKQGVPASVAMTQIRSAIVATNEVLGDGAFKTLSLQEGFQKMYESANGSQNELLKTAGRIEAVNAIIGIAGDNFKGASDDLDAMANSAGSVDRSFKTITSTNANQWEIFRNRIKATTKGIGDAVLEMSTSVVTDLNKIFETNDKLSGAYKIQSEKINELYIEYTSLNVEEKRRLEIIEEIRRINPSVVSGINDQTKAYDKLGDAIRKYNEYVLNKEIVDEKFADDISNTQDVVDDYKTKSKKIQVELYEDYADFIANLPKLRGTYQDDLNNILDGEGNRLDKIREIRKLIIDQNQNTGPGSSSNINVPFSDIKDYDEAIKTATFFTKFLKEQKDERDQYLNNLQDTEESSSYVIDEINKINSIAELNSKFANYETTSIKKAVEQRQQYLEKRKEIQGELGKISSITSEEYKQNNNVLKKYLESDIEEIKKAAEQKEKYFNYKTPKTPGDDDRTPNEKFADDLKIKEEQYKHYNLALKNEDQEFAKKLKESYKLKEEDYITYLRNLYNISQSDGSKALILESLDKQGTSLSGQNKFELPEKLKTLPVNLDFKIDTTSINAIEREISNLESERKSAITKAERDILQVKIANKKKELDIANNGNKKEGDLYNNLTRSIGDLNNKQLRDYKDYWVKKLKLAKKGSDAAAEAEGNIQNANEEISDNVSSTITDVGSALSGLSDLFSKFGDEDTAQLLGQLSGVADGIASIASGDIVGGSLAILNSALTVEVVSDTAKFEAAIKELEKVAIQIQNNIKNTVGVDRAKEKLNYLDNIKQKEKDLILAQEAEAAARKQVKFLGIDLWKKGSGSGTDQGKLEELEADAEAAKQELIELKEEYNSFITGTTRDTLADSIFEGLKAGKRGIEDFAQAFEDIVGESILNTFKRENLEALSQDFLNAFGNATDSDGDGVSDLTEEEINALRNQFNSNIQQATSNFEELEQFLQQAGIDLNLGDSGASGLSGAISTITEDTANILAGTLNSIRIDISTGLGIAVENTQLLSRIADNTSYNRFLESIDNRMGNIEGSLLKIEALG